MNTSQYTTTTTQSVAYRFGVEAAQRGEPCDPEIVFIQRAEQIKFAAGYESAAGVTLTTSFFTGSELPKPTTVTVPNYRSNDRERVRRTDNNVARIFQMATAHDKRLQAMADKTAAFMGGIFEGDVIFA